MGSKNVKETTIKVKDGTRAQTKDSLPFNPLAFPLPSREL